MKDKHSFSGQGNVLTADVLSLESPGGGIKSRLGSFDPCFAEKELGEVKYHAFSLTR